MKINVGNYVIEIGVRNEVQTTKTILRVHSLFITKISDTYKDMKLSEWINKKDIENYVSEYHDLKNENLDIVFSKQPRKR